MPAYQPGQGISQEAKERLAARRKAAAEEGGVPAAEENEQWSRLLGEGAKKKLRCASCTRPLSEEEKAGKLLECFRCTGGGEVARLPHPSALAGEELGPDILRYLRRAAPRAAQPRSSDTSSRPREQKSASDAAAPAQSAQPANGRAAARRAEEARFQVLARGEPVRAGGTLLPPGRTAFSILSFNLLADCYVRVPGQPWNAFEHCEDAQLAWEGRLPRILQLLTASDADVVCLQEVVLELRAAAGGGPEQWQLPAWLEELQGYTSVLQGLKPAEWEKNSERNLRAVGKKSPTGLATLYKTERFEEAAPAKHGSGSGSVLFLRCREPPADGATALEVAVANVHLAGDPSKAGQHVTALNSLKKNLGKQELRAICGDFNGEAEPGSEVGQWLAREGFREAGAGATWAEPGKAMRLDHIFHTVGLQLLAASAPLSAEEVAKGLPCDSCPSDHTPVAALLSGAMRGRCPW